MSGLWASGPFLSDFIPCFLNFVSFFGGGMLFWGGLVLLEEVPLSRLSKWMGRTLLVLGFALMSPTLWYFIRPIFYYLAERSGWIPR